eukprot:Colp12_sorted_trinity150504_noHs@5886
MLGGIRTAFSRHPFVANTLTCCGLYVLRDVLEQKVEGHEKFDWARTARMGVVGLAVMGPINHYWYLWLDRRVPVAKTAKTLAQKVFFDQTLYAPVATTVFYTAMGLTEGRAIGEVATEIRAKLLPTYLVDLVVWPPYQIINFYFVPAHFRVAFVAVGSTFWNMFLSYMKHSDGKLL